MIDEIERLRAENAALEHALKDAVAMEYGEEGKRLRAELVKARETLRQIGEPQLYDDTKELMEDAEALDHIGYVAQKALRSLDESGLLK